jgi:hypothetical protein
LLCFALEKVGKTSFFQTFQKLSLAYIQSYVASNSCLLQFPEEQQSRLDQLAIQICNIKEGFDRIECHITSAKFLKKLYEATE